MDLWANSRLKGGERVEREERERELLFDGPHTKLTPLASFDSPHTKLAHLFGSLRANLRLKCEG